MTFSRSALHCSPVTDSYLLFSIHDLLFRRPLLAPAIFRPEWRMRDWRFCNKCEVLFYNLDGQQGICAAGNGHVAAGYKFVLNNLVRFD